MTNQKEKKVAETSVQKSTELDFLPFVSPYEFSFSLSLGFNQANTDYEKSLRYNYESLKAPSWSLAAKSRLRDYQAHFSYINAPAQVQSSGGHLNVFGWKYRHHWLDGGLGYLWKQKHIFSLQMAFHYSPILFPTTVGVFKSEAAFEQVPLIGWGVGYETRIRLYDFPIKLAAQVYNMTLDDSAYDLKYGWAWNLKLNPYYQWKNFRWGLIYNYTGQILSLKEKNTGQDYPFKSVLRLHQFLFNLEVFLN